MRTCRYRIKKTLQSDPMLTSKRSGTATLCAVEQHRLPTKLACVPWIIGGKVVSPTPSPRIHRVECVPNGSLNRVEQHWIGGDGIGFGDRKSSHGMTVHP